MAARSAVRAGAAADLAVPVQLGLDEASYQHPGGAGIDWRAVAASGLDLTIRYDERLRERDFGAFDGMTRAGIIDEFPEEAKRRDLLGKFYYRPPGGESWADVALRVRSLLADLRHGFEDERLWLFTHQAVIMGFRYVLEGLSEADLMEIDRSEQLPNCSLTTYTRTDQGLELKSYADTTAVDQVRAPVTDDA